MLEMVGKGNGYKNETGDRNWEWLTVEVNTGEERQVLETTYKKQGKKCYIQQKYSFHSNPDISLFPWYNKYLWNAFANCLIFFCAEIDGG